MSILHLDCNKIVTQHQQTENAHKLKEKNASMKNTLKVHVITINLHIKITLQNQHSQQIVEDKRFVLQLCKHA
jgi:hypothetical protein